MLRVEIVCDINTYKNESKIHLQFHPEMTLYFLIIYIYLYSNVLVSIQR